MGTGGKQRWRFTLLRSPSNLLTKPPPTPPPEEFICPISGELMADPVIVSSGQTFERNCVLACISLSYKPTAVVDFTTVIPNLALKSAIISWCSTNSFVPNPRPLDLRSAVNIVQSLINDSPKVRLNRLSSCLVDSPPLPMNDSPKFPPLNRLSSCLSSTSDDSVVAGAAVCGGGLDSCSTTPLPMLKTRPFCYSSSSSSEIDNPIEEDEEIVSKLRSGSISDQEEAVVNLRRMTRTKIEARIYLCTPRLMAALRHLILSRSNAVQVNSVASLVNLSLEDCNKVKIVRSGIVPPLIDVLRGGGGSPEAQDHAAGALFSLALDDQNKTAIGVLGALPPLLHALRAGSDRSRHDSALALYHLSLVQSNRAKLVRLGSVQVLLNMLKSGQMSGRVMLILNNLAGSVEGRAAMLDGGAVECLLGFLSRAEFDSESTRECCLGALCGLSQGGLRFKGLAKEAGAEEVLAREAAGAAPERCREKAERVLEVLRRREEEEEEVVDWEALLNSSNSSDELTRSRFELVYGKG